MSRLKELIDEAAADPDADPLAPDEAEAAKAEEASPEPDPEPDPEPASDVAGEKAFALLERAAGNYGKAVAKALDGSPVKLDPCPCCSIPGLVAPYEPMNPHEAERKAAVDAYFGMALPDYRTATDAVKCEACDGWGKTLTGSRDANFVTKACSACAGQGWVLPTQAPYQAQGSPTGGNPFPPWPAFPNSGLAASANGEPYPGYGISFVPIPGGTADAWQRPAGHPQWGIDPAGG